MQTKYSRVQECFIPIYKNMSIRESIGGVLSKERHLITMTGSVIICPL